MGEVRSIYQYLLSSIGAEYETVRTIKNSERGCVSLLQNKQNGTRFIFRHYRGNGEVYRKLLGISCPNLPQIMEAAECSGMVAVLEEYIQGDSLAYLLEGAVFTPMKRAASPCSFATPCGCCTQWVRCTGTSSRKT